MVYQLNFLKMAVSGKECPADIHAAGGNPYIIDWNFSSLRYQMVINESVFSGDIPVDVDNTNLEFGNNFLKLFLVTPGRSKRYQTPIGYFSYNHIPLSCFASGMDIYTDEFGLSSLIAAPEKALADKIHTGPQLRTRKDLELYLLEDLRINPSDLAQMRLKMVTEYCKIFGSSKIELFLQVMKHLQQKGRQR